MCLVSANQLVQCIYLSTPYRSVGTGEVDQLSNLGGFSPLWEGQRDQAILWTFQLEDDGISSSRFSNEPMDWHFSNLGDDTLDASWYHSNHSGTSGQPQHRNICFDFNCSKLLPLGASRKNSMSFERLQSIEIPGYSPCFFWTLTLDYSIFLLRSSKYHEFGEHTRTY